MFKALGDYILKQRYGMRTQRGFTAWDKVKNICIVAEKGNFLNERALTDAFKKNGKEFDLVLFHPDKVGKDDVAYVSMNKKDVGVLSLPKPELAAKLRSKVYDVLIDFNEKGNRSTKALSTCVQAKCKVGHSGLTYSDIFDLCIDLKGGVKQEEYLSQLLNYLKMIKTNN